MKEFCAEIEINASVARVWQCLTDFASYTEWNPFIYRAVGNAAVGARLKLWLRLHDGLRIKVQTTVVRVRHEQELCWIGHLMTPGLVDGEHRLIIESIDATKVLFKQHETYGGRLLPLFWRRLQKDAGSGFEAMNRALKLHLEQGIGRSGRPA
jgi:hypothetical protein